MAHVGPGGRGADIFWIARTNGDPYRDRCGEHFAIRDFDNLYDPVADALTSKSDKLLVINALAAGSELKDAVKALAGSGLFTAIFVYTTAPRIARYVPNGDARILPAGNPEQLLQRLRAAVQAQPVESKNTATERPADKPAVAWPSQPPGATSVEAPPPAVEETAAQPQDILPAARKPEPPAPVKAPSEPAQTPAPAAREFQPAPLTEEELQALLGPEFESENSEGEGNHE